MDPESTRRVVRMDTWEPDQPQNEGSLERQKKRERERVPYDQLVARVEELESQVKIFLHGSE